MKRVLPIVEGQGDATAVPALMRRVAAEHGIHNLEILTPHRRGDLPKIRSRLSDFLEAARLENAPVFWVLDYDCQGCVDVDADMAQLAAESERLAPDMQIKYSLIVKEFESLFLVDEPTTRRVFKDIPAEITFPDKPEEVRGAKEWLSKARPKGQAYKETTHQEKLASQLDLTVLRHRSPSFVRFEAALLELIS